MHTPVTSVDILSDETVGREGGCWRVLAALLLAACGSDTNTVDAATMDAAVIDGPGIADGAVASCTPVNGTTVVLAPFASNLQDPVMITGAPGDPRQFIIEQAGAIRVVKDGALVVAPFLDLTSLVLGGGERGLLGIAFHPDFAENQRFYVHFTRLNDGDHTIAEFTATAGTDTAAITTRRDVLTFDDPYSTNNGGMLEFGIDDKLYIAIGDGGLAGDPQDRAQSDASLFGKILRIDVDTRTGTKQYGIPGDNPFISSPDGPFDPRPEIWHKGLRNPFRFSFDRANGNIYIGDVGEDRYEEINAGPNSPSLNWGWDDREGAHCFEPMTGCLTADRREPVVEHTDVDGWHSVIGGQVYRGTCYPGLVGTYFYGDYFKGELWAFEPSGGVATNVRMVVPNVGPITAIHADAQGELYVVTHSGVVRKITAQ
jgi:glucose/arabinose dehydrogenase